jgi:filamentous hemagglutinin
VGEAVVAGAVTGGLVEGAGTLLRGLGNKVASELLPNISRWSGGDEDFIAGLWQRTLQIRADARDLYGGSIGARRNVGFAEYNIGGETDTLIGVSGEAVRPGTVDLPTTRFFAANPANAYDSEAKIFENVASRFAGNRDVGGTLNLFSEGEPCSSCYGVMEQFATTFPNIQVNYDWYIPRGFDRTHYF